MDFLVGVITTLVMEFPRRFVYLVRMNFKEMHIITKHMCLN